MTTLGSMEEETSSRVPEADIPTPMHSRRSGRLGRALRDHPTTCLAVVLTVLAAVPRVMTATHGFITADEPLWMPRADDFYHALSDADLGSFSAYQGRGRTVTMPGITTMWIGVMARGVWSLGQGLGIWTDDTGDFGHSALGLDIAQVLYALVSAALVGLLVVLVARWAGLVAAGVAGLVVATEPFFVAQGAVLHTDELLTFCGIGSLVALALALGVPHRTQWADRRSMALLAGGLFALAWLTKVSAVMFLPAAGLLVVSALVRNGRATLRQPLTWLSAGPERRIGLTAAVAALVLVVILYPAVWADPFDEAYWLVRSATQSVRDHTQFFLGEARPTPGPLFYPVAVPLRITPWFLLAGLVAGVVVWRKPTRGYGIAALCMTVPPFVILTFSAKQFDRYGLPLLAVGSIVIGVVVSNLVDRARDWSAGARRGLRGAGAALVAVATVNSLVVVPWGLTYFNPALGGSSVAEDTLTVGWGEGIEGAIRIIEEREGGSCEGVTVWVPVWARGMLPFWGCKQPPKGDYPTYVVLDIYERQRMDDDDVQRYQVGRELVGTVEARGLVLAQVYALGGRD